MVQKIIKVGNSAAITIPKEFLAQSGLQVGDEMSIETDAKLQLILARSKKKASSPSLTPEFKQWLDKFIDDYRPVLQKLAKM